MVTRGWWGGGRYWSKGTNFYIRWISSSGLKYSMVAIRGRPKENKNYVLEGKPLIAQASPARWVFWEPICISVPAGVVVRGCMRLKGIFLEDSFNMFALIMLGDLQAYLPTLCWVFSSSWPKMAWPLCLTFPIHLISPKQHFFVSPDEKSPQRETLCQCGRSKTKNGRSTKRHQNWWVQKLFWAVKKVSIDILHQMVSILKVTEV